MRTVRIFVSSPIDVAQERFLARGVVERLQGEFSGRLELDVVAWEYEPLLATDDFQAQIPSPAGSDIFVTILWSRLGSPLPERFRRQDGSRYRSGTEFEFEAALESFKATGRPHVLVYRKTAVATVSLEDATAVLEQIEQKRAVERFTEKWFSRGVGAAVHAYHTFDTLERFETVLESHLRKLLLSYLRDAAPVRAPVTWTGGSPFRGLHAFEPEHAPVFFGRTRATAEIVQALRHQAQSGRAFLLVLGMSGVGKSSVVKAGVLPMLSRSGAVRGVSSWASAAFSPADSPLDPVQALAKALMQSEALPRLAEAVQEHELTAMLATHPEAVVPLLRVSLGDEHARLLVIVDQLEELFTHAYEREGAGEAFAHALAALAGSGIVWIVATLRSDFYPCCQVLPELMVLKEGRGQYDLAPPTPSEISQMIRLPARAAGLTFEEDTATGERLDDVLRDHACANPEMLPLLEFTLEELYRRRSPDGLLSYASYHEIGGVEGSIARRAEDVYTKLSPGVQAELDHTLDRLVTRRAGSDSSAAGERAHVDELSENARVLVDAFVTARLFVTELDETGRVSARIAHESLIKQWPRIQQWLADNEENLRLHARLRDALERWQAEPSADLLLGEGKPLEEARLLQRRGVGLTPAERDFVERSERLVRRNHRVRTALAGALLTLTVTAGISAVVALQQSRRAQVEAETATATTDFLVGLFEVSDPWTGSGAPGAEVTAREILDRGAGQVIDGLTDQPHVQANLLHAIGQVYQGLGLADQAEPMLEQALTTRRRLLGEHHPQVAQTLHGLAFVAFHRGDFALAERRLANAVRIWRNSTGDASLDRALAMNLLSVVVANQDRYDEALAIQQEALTIQEQHPEVSAGDLAQSYNNLGYVLMNADRYAEARRALERALAVTEESDALGVRARAMSNLGAAHQVMGNVGQARELHEQALELKRQWFEPGHAEIGYSLNNLAWVVRAQGDYDRAVRLYEQAIENFVGALGEEHLNVAVVRGNMARALREAGRYEQAIGLYRKALGGIAATAGERSSYALPVHVGLGHCFESLGRSDAAAEHYRRAVGIGDDVNPRAWDVGVALGMLAALPESLMSREERIQTFDRSLEILAETGGGRTPERARVLVAYSRHLHAAGQRDSAMALFAEALSIQGELMAEDDPMLLEHQAEFEQRYGRRQQGPADGDPTSAIR